MSRDTATAAALVALCAVLIAATFEIRETAYATPGAEVWPRIVLGWLAVLVVAYLVRSLVRAARGQAEPAAAAGLSRNVVWCFALFAAFLLALPYVGMLAGGIAFVFAALSVMGRRGARAIAGHAALAVVSVAAVWTIFTFGLNVMLPAGKLFATW